MAATEVRVTSSTGGAKGSKLAAYAQIPAGPLKMLAEQYGRGNEKYEQVNGRDNWRNGYPWSLSFSAMMRHAWAFWSGEDDDPEFGAPHLVAVAWHAFALLHWMGQPDLVRQFDDRQDATRPASPDEARDDDPRTTAQLPQKLTDLQ